MAALLPPPQYDVPPPMPVIEYVMPWSDLQQVCFGLTAKWNGVIEAQGKRAVGGWGGCSGIDHDTGKCIIYRVDDDDIRRHELGHCSGWSRDHPGGWYRK